MLLVLAELARNLPSGKLREAFQREVSHVRTRCKATNEVVVINGEVAYQWHSIVKSPNGVLGAGLLVASVCIGDGAREAVHTPEAKHWRVPAQCRH